MVYNGFYLWVYFVVSQGFFRVAEEHSEADGFLAFGDLFAAVDDKEFYGFE